MWGLVTGEFTFLGHGSIYIFGDVRRGNLHVLGEGDIYIYIIIIPSCFQKEKLSTPTVRRKFGAKLVES